MSRCGWHTEGGSVGCCLTAGHEVGGVTHCPHPGWSLTPRPREIVRRTDGRLVACVRVLNTVLDADATREPL